MATGRGGIAATQVSENKRMGAGLSVSRLCVVVLALVLLPQLSVTAQAVLPGFRAPLPEQPATVQDYINKLGQGSDTVGPAIDDPEITELARGLKYDPGLMYKFVHDHIRFTPTWGETKGAYMTWMDRCGNGFDQSSLLIALLTEAAAHGSYTITNIQYGVGDINLTGAQFMAWFGVPNDVRIAREVLARGGFYGAVTAGANDQIASVQMVHVWVKADIGGQTYRMDPSFKSHTTDYGIVNLWDAMEYYGTPTFIAACEDGNGGWDKESVHANLDEYTENLIDYIKTHVESGDMTDSVDDVIGDLRIDPVEETALPPQTLPYHPNYTEREDFPIGQIRSLHRTTLRIQHSGIDRTFYSSQIYGRRLSLAYNGSNQPQLVLDGVVQATGTAATPGQWYDLIVTVDHPYETADFDGSTTLRIQAGGFYQIANGWGNTGTKVLLKHRGLLQQYKLDGESETSEKILGESYAIVGLTWLAKTTAMRNLAAELGDDYTITNHHMVGVVGQYDAPYMNLAMGYLGVVDYGDSDNPSKMFYVIAQHTDAYGHEVIGSLQDCNAVSSARLLEAANDDPNIGVVRATSGNWWSVEPNLVGYSEAEKDQVEEYLNAGFDVYLPADGNMVQGDWTGMGFQALYSGANAAAMACIVGDTYQGGTFSTEDVNSVTLLDNSFGAASDGDPEGAYGAGSTDITIGGGGFPYGLAFGRQYSSHRRTKDGPLGLGWTHNLDISAKVASDSWQYLGAGSGTEAAPHIVGLYIAEKIAPPDYSTLTLTSLCATWLTDKMKDNIVDIKQGSAISRFTKVIDEPGDVNDVYHAPSGGTIKLLKRSNGNFRLKNAGGIFYDFDSDGHMSQWSDAHGNLVDFTYASGKITQVAGKIVPSGGGAAVTARSLSFTYTGDLITAVTDSADRTISYTYDANDQLIECENPDGYTVTYEYDPNVAGLLCKVYPPDEPNEPNHPVITVGYDSLGRMIQQTDANDDVWDFYRATYRTEVLPPAQRDPNNEVKRYGSVTWANAEARTVTSKDAMGRITTTEYDPQGRTDLVTGPSGTSTEYEYDSNNNVVRIDSLSIPDSNDPNVFREFGYCSYGEPNDPEQRWFVNLMQQTDSTGQKGYYYYDYNEPTNPGYLGELRKIAYMPSDPNTDANRPTVQFTYYPDGQIKCKKQKKDASNYIFSTFEYYAAADGAGLKKAIADANGLNITTEAGYDDVGRTIWSKDPKGNIATSEYSAGGRLLKTIAPAPFSYETVYEYYADGKVKHVKQVAPGGLADDPNCVALWRLEDGALTADSTGANTLTNSGVTASTANKWEGDASGDFVRSESDNLSILDANLAADFPLKYGASSKSFTVCTAVRFDMVSTSTQSLYAVFGKSNYAQAGKRGFYFGNYYSSGSKMLFAFGYNSGNSDQWVWHNGAIAAGRWYHIGVSYDDSTKRVRARIWDDTAQAILGTDINVVLNNPLYVSDVPLMLGGRPGGGVYFDGLIDEVAVFDRVLTADEIDDVRQGAFGPSPETTYLQSILYNARGQKAEVWGPYPEGATSEQLQINRTKFRYDALGRQVDVNDAEGNITTTYYYPDGKTWKVVDAEGHATVTNTYNPDGSLKEVEDAEGRVTSYEYNGFMGVKKTLYEDDTYKEPDYDGFRRVIGERTRAGQTIESTYDGFGRVETKTVKNADNSVVNTITYTYDLLGRLLTTTDNTGTITNTYDNAGRVTQIVYPGSKTVAYQYDIAGRRTRLTYPDSTYITYTYDELGRLTAVKNSSGTALAAYTYDALSRRTALDYANGAGVEYSYDTANRLLSLDNSTGSGQYLYEYAYDKVGNRTSMAVTDSGGTKMHVYGYDKTYQVTEVNYPVGYEYLATDTTYNYDAVGNRISVIDAGGTTNYTTNALNQYTAVGGVPYVYDDNGNLTYDGDNMVYGYDPENRLTTVTNVEGQLAAACDVDLTFTTDSNAPWFLQTEEYYYDGDAVQSGDIDDTEETWLQTTVTGSGYLRFRYKRSCEYGDEFTLFIDGSYRLGQNGAIDGDWIESGAWYISGSGTHTIRWRYSKNGSGSAGEDCVWVDYVRWSGTMPDAGAWGQIEYVYDPFGRRIEKKVDGDTELKFLYDGDHIIAEYDANDTLLRKYVHGPCVDQPICMIETTGDYAGTQYYHYDALGSVVALTDPNGDVVQLYEYSVYGQVAASDANHPNRFMFTGREFDKDTGLYYYRARYYHPEIGRFLQTDPAGYGDGMNLYRYCGNGPTVWIDPLGLFSIAFYDGSNPAYAESADDFDVAIDVQAHSDEYTDTEWILFVLEFLVNIGAEPTDVYFFDDSAVMIKPYEGGDPPEVVLDWIEFGDERFIVSELPLSNNPEQDDGGELEAFFKTMGKILNPTGKEPGDAPQVHLRQSNAALGTDGCDYLRHYSTWTGLIMTSVEGFVVHGGEEIGGSTVPDYWFEPVGPGKSDPPLVYTSVPIRTYNEPPKLRWGTDVKNPQPIW